MALVCLCSPGGADVNAQAGWVRLSAAAMTAEGVDLVSHDYIRTEGASTTYISCAHNFSRRPDPFVDYLS